MLPFVIQTGSVRPPDGNPLGWLLLLLAGTIGVPFFVLSTSASVFQYWLSRTDHPSARDPYFLYSASNLGCLLALASYPTIVEPLLTLREQSRLWATGYAEFVLLAVACAAIAWRRSGTPPSARAADAACEPAPRRWRGAPRAMGRVGVCAVEPDAGGHEPHLHRRRRGAAPVDRAARALSRDVRARVRPALGHGRRIREARAAARRRAARALHDGRRAGSARDDRLAAPRGVRSHRAELSRRARERSPGAFAPDGVLFLGVVRRHARRTVQRARRPAAVQQHPRVPAGRSAGVPVVSIVRFAVGVALRGDPRHRDAARRWRADRRYLRGAGGYACVARGPARGARACRRCSPLRNAEPRGSAGASRR